MIVLLAIAIHGPLLFMQLPASSYDTNFHIFLASHYSQHWFNPWNEKWFAGFSQTTYPPLTHQWIALFSKIIGLDTAYMLVQLIFIVLLVVGVMRYARIWVDESAASYAAIGSIFLGALAFLVYGAGQLATVAAAALFLNALPFLYEWLVSGSIRSLLKGLVLAIAAASAHHVTLIFGALLFALPVLWVAYLDSKHHLADGSPFAVLSRAFAFLALCGIGVTVVLLPFWIALIQHPIKQIPIPHPSRENFLLDSLVATNYFIVPYGLLLLALPFVVIRGSAVQRLRPLLFGFWLTFLFGLGGTTPIPRWLLGRAFEVLTFERFTLWAALMALPFVGLLAVELIDRFHTPAQLALSLAAIACLALALGWIAESPYRSAPLSNVEPVTSFLNRDGHDQYRYLTLGFGSSLAKVSAYTDAGSVDGDYNSARLLPEMTQYGGAQLTNAKFNGSAGMESLRAMLKHANRYGLKYIFVADPYYEPLLAFAGWRKIETYNGGEISAWSKDDVPPAHKIESDAMPPPWQGLLWGTLPIGSSFLAILLVFMLPARRPAREELGAFAPANEHSAA